MKGIEFDSSNLHKSGRYTKKRIIIIRRRGTEGGVKYMKWTQMSEDNKWERGFD